MAADGERSFDTDSRGDLSQRGGGSGWMARVVEGGFFLVRLSERRLSLDPEAVLDGAPGLATTYSPTTGLVRLGRVVWLIPTGLLA
jgi:hypothetical protein